MLATAAGLGYSESAFLTAPRRVSAARRAGLTTALYFSPKAEVNGVSPP